LEFAESLSSGNDTENEKKFKGKFLKVENPDAPSSLKWQN
jgi:hypothetical protein